MGCLFQPRNQWGNTMSEKETAEVILERPSNWDTLQQNFVKKVNDIVENQVDSIQDEDLSMSDIRDVANGVAGDILELIEGEGSKKNPGYFMVPKTAKPKQLPPDQFFQTQQFMENTSIADGLAAMFAEINN